MAASEARAGHWWSVNGARERSGEVKRHHGQAATAAGGSVPRSTLLCSVNGGRPWRDAHGLAARPRACACARRCGGAGAARVQQGTGERVRAAVRASRRARAGHGRGARGRGAALQRGCVRQGCAELVWPWRRPGGGGGAAEPCRAGGGAGVSGSGEGRARARRAAEEEGERRGKERKERKKKKMGKRKEKEKGGER